jgi:hypothetical protein
MAKGACPHTGYSCPCASSVRLGLHIVHQFSHILPSSVCCVIDVECSINPTCTYVCSKPSHPYNNCKLSLTMMPSVLSHLLVGHDHHDHYLCNEHDAGCTGK